MTTFPIPKTHHTSSLVSYSPIVSIFNKSLDYPYTLLLPVTNPAQKWNFFVMNEINNTLHKALKFHSKLPKVAGSLQSFFVKFRTKSSEMRLAMESTTNTRFSSRVMLCNWSTSTSSLTPVRKKQTILVGLNWKLKLN